MTNALANAAEAAAIPTAINIVLALKQFKADLGPDPAKIPLTVGPAFLKVTATVELQAPALLTSEWGAVQSNFDTQADSWITALQAKQASLTAPAPAPTPAVVPA